MQVMICDDEIVYREAIYNAIQNWQCSSGHQDIQISVFSSSKELYECFEQQVHADLLFLDIEMPREISGLDLARRIRDLNNNIIIVFVTNYDEYVYDGYEVNAFRFLRKPIVEKDIFFCCSYVYNRLFCRPEDSITFSFKNSQMVLRFSEIQYIEAQSHTLFIYCSNHNEPIKTQMRLSDLYAILPSKLFSYCHRSYIVNVSYIRIITRSRIVLLNGITIPVSRTYVELLNNTFDFYFRGGRIKNGLDSI